MILKGHAIAPILWSCKLDLERTCQISSMYNSSAVIFQFNAPSPVIYWAQMCGATYQNQLRVQSSPPAFIKIVPLRVFVTVILLRFMVALECNNSCDSRRSLLQRSSSLDFVRSAVRPLTPEHDVKTTARPL